MSAESQEEKSWLSYLSLSDEYERRARFLPSLLTFCFLLPASPVIGNVVDSFIDMLIGGIGIGAVFAIGISHLASIAGNRCQDALFPRWPHSSPTNRWLHPDNKERSSQQKKLWYEEYKTVTGLDIACAIEDTPEEIEVIINDAVTKARVELRKSNNSGLLFKHNVDYGYARNFTGLRYLWLTFTIISTVASWYNYIYGKGDLIWGIISTGIMIFAVYLAFVALPSYVKRKAERYAESFYGALAKLANNRKKTDN
jgi:hypothetical protein